MCEFYPHGYLLQLDRDFNPVPYVGDIHLRALTSYAFNQIHWQKACDTFESNQVTKLFIVRGEHGRSDTVYNKHHAFLKFEENKERMLRTQRWCLDLWINQLTVSQKEALDCFQRRWMMLPTAVRNREPFGVPNFAWALPRIPRYVACVQTCGIRWMGLQFQYLVIWLTAEVYTPTCNVPAYWWKEVLLSYRFRVPGTEMALEYNLAGLHEAHSLQNLDLRR